MVLTISGLGLSLIFIFATSFLFPDCGFIIPQGKAFFCDEVTLIQKIRRFLSTGIYCIVTFLFQAIESICIPQRDRASS